MAKKNPLELPYELQFSAWDDFKFTLGGFFILALPLIGIGLIALFVSAFI